MIRRIYVPVLRSGEVLLDESEARHARDVLRLVAGDQIELFDATGQTSLARLSRCDRKSVTANVDTIQPASATSALIVASAIPKGERAEWMIEKLSEVGVTRFVPLITERSVVAPQGSNKIDRWRRIAIESAKQCRRVGVMSIDAPTKLETAIDAETEIAKVYLSTARGLRRLSNLVAGDVMLFIGPEGDWSESEVAMFAERGLTPATLTTTILRVETAAVLAAGFVACIGSDS